MSRRRELALPGAFALALGVWVSVSAAAGGREAWDTGAYWSVGLPVLYLGTAALASGSADALWKFWLASLLGQFVGLLATAAGWSLWPLGLIMLALLSLPVPLVAAAARKLRRRYWS